MCMHGLDMVNRSPRKNKTSWFLGVWCDQVGNGKPWKAERAVNCKHTKLGHFADQESEAGAHCEAAEVHHVEPANLSIPPGGVEGAMETISRERIEKCARLYPSSKAAAQALGIAPQSFGRLCRRYGVETPRTRRGKKRRRAQALAAQVHCTALTGEE
ncbi:MAG: hypothetical protein FJX77_03095 [Armatimonadetes bacterium]|nr:hypothetical protein [Armatimonadota bacterium]